MASSCPKCKEGKIKQGKCNKCGQKIPRSKREGKTGWDRWANGNQYGSFNSDDD